jgi:hypothetical protein
MLTEDITLTWFITAGAMTQLETTRGNGQSNAWQENVWSLTGALGASAEIIIVLRDNRGGVGWIRRTVAIGGTR